MDIALCKFFDALIDHRQHGLRNGAIVLLVKTSSRNGENVITGPDEFI